MIKLKEIFQKQYEQSFLLRNESIDDRITRLNKIEKWVLSNRSEIHHALDLDLGKSQQETDITEVIPLLTELRVAKKSLKEWAKPKAYSSSVAFFGTKAYVHHEPKGVCLIISPWNYPFLLTIGPLISALAAGNTVFLKPSEYTPSVSSMIKNMMSVLFQEEIVTTVEGDAQVSKSILQLPFNHIFFTGSPQVGKLVMKAASEHLASVTLELGGKSPTIVDETASIAKAALKIAWGKYVNAGQTCVAPDYVFVHSSIKDEFISELIKRLKAFTSDKRFYTKIITKQHFDRLLQLISESKLLPENSIFQGNKDKDKLNMETQVYLNVPFDSKMMNEEIFGPLLPVFTYDDIAEVIDYINKNQKPLALYHFSKSSRNQKKVLNETSSGGVVFNDCVLQFAHPSLPMGGVNNSGIGKSHGQHGFQSFSNEKSILKQRSGHSTVQLLYPSYTKWKNKLIEILIKYF